MNYRENTKFYFLGDTQKYIKDTKILPEKSESGLYDEELNGIIFVAELDDMQSIAELKSILPQIGKYTSSIVLFISNEINTEPPYEIVTLAKATTVISSDMLYNFLSFFHTAFYSDDSYINIDFEDLGAIFGIHKQFKCACINCDSVDSASKEIDIIVKESPEYLMAYIYVSKEATLNSVNDLFRPFQNTLNPTTPHAIIWGLNFSDENKGCKIFFIYR